MVKSAALASNGKNYYEFLGITQNAQKTQIGKAYRLLSLQLHPDRNKSQNANDQFNELKIIYETLKDQGRRELYNIILKAYKENKKRFQNQREERQHFISQLNRKTQKHQAKPSQQQQQSKQKQSELDRIIRQNKEAEWKEEQALKQKDSFSLHREKQSYQIEVTWKSSIFSQTVLRQIFSNYALILSIQYFENKAYIAFINQKTAEQVLSQAKVQLSDTGLKMKLGGASYHATKDNLTRKQNDFIQQLRQKMMIDEQFSKSSHSWEEYYELENKILGEFGQ